MKLLLLLLPILVACNGSGGSGGRSSTDKYSVTRDITTNVAIYSDEFFLSEYLPRSMSGVNCGLNPEPGKRYVYRINRDQDQDRLVIEDEGKKFFFTRESSALRGAGLYGKWLIESPENNMLSDSSIEFSDDQNSVQIISKCFRD